MRRKQGFLFCLKKSERTKSLKEQLPSETLEDMPKSKRDRPGQNSFFLDSVMVLLSENDTELGSCEFCSRRQGFRFSKVLRGTLFWKT